ncbi:MAG: hypothetical protein EBR33_12115, partial [Synechococcaceae bacterium WB4_1_0192]|nr:hypothetical protein [Synechococcaceae bacterium WB4_1_0192]
MGCPVGLLADGNRRLVSWWQAVQDCPAELLAHMRRFAERHNARPAETWASESPRADRATLAEQGAWLWYVQSAGFNGLHRVSQAGRFNVALGKDGHGAPYRLTVPEAEVWELSPSLLACDVKHHEVGCVPGLFASRSAELEVGEGDVLYADPPYLGTFSAYTSGGFGLEATAR